MLGDRIPNGMHANVPIIGQTRRPHPEVGSVFPIPTAGGVVLFRVEKASVYRTTLVPLSEREEHELVATLNQQAYARAAYRVCLGVSVCAAFLLRKDRLETEVPSDDDNLAAAIAEAHPLQCPYFLEDPTNRCVRANDGHEQHAFPEVPSAE